LQGRDDFQVWPAEKARRHRRTDEQVIKSGGPIQEIHNSVDASGNDRHLLVVKFPLPDASGATGVGGIGIDVTERYRLARTVRQLLKRLVDTQEAERRKVAADLHDLIGQKLTALGISLDILSQGLSPESAAAVSERLGQMRGLVDDTVGAIREVMA